MEAHGKAPRTLPGFRLHLSKKDGQGKTVYKRTSPNRPLPRRRLPGSSPPCALPLFPSALPKGATVHFGYPSSPPKGAGNRRGAPPEKESGSSQPQFFLNRSLSSVTALPQSMSMLRSAFLSCLFFALFSLAISSFLARPALRCSAVRERLPQSFSRVGES